MSSVLVELGAGYLLESAMADFRDNWLAHLRAVVDQSIKDHGGAVKAGRSAVAQKLELGEQTLYQILEGKSGKKYPTAETMAIFEKKFGPDLPPGWTSQPMGKAQVAAPKAAEMTESQWQMLQDFEMLIEEDRHAIRKTLKEKAESMRKVFEEFRRRHNLPAPTSNERVAESFGPPPPPAGPGGWKKITPVPTAPKPTKTKEK